MTERFILASGSAIRAQMLRQAGVGFEVLPARVDEVAMREAMLVEKAGPRDIADALAEMKARRVSEKVPGAWVLGCDQVLALEGDLMSKAETPDDARAQLKRLSGKTHQLYSAAVIHEGGQPIWRHVGVVRLTMRRLSEGYIDDYVARNWDSIRHSVGCYLIEAEGVRLFSRIQGDYFAIQGLPLVELLSFLTLRERLPS